MTPGQDRDQSGLEPSQTTWGTDRGYKEGTSALPSTGDRAVMGNKAKEAKHHNKSKQGTKEVEEYGARGFNKYAKFTRVGDGKAFWKAAAQELASYAAQVVECAVPFCAVPCRAVLCCAALCCAVLCGAVLCCTLPCPAVLRCAVLCCVLFCYILTCCVVVQCCAVTCLAKKCPCCVEHKYCGVLVCNVSIARRWTPQCGLQLHSAMLFQIPRSCAIN